MSLKVTMTNPLKQKSKTKSKEVTHLLVTQVGFQFLSPSPTLFMGSCKLVTSEPAHRSWRWTGGHPKASTSKFSLEMRMKVP